VADRAADPAPGVTVSDRAADPAAGVTVSVEH
jgi:hypothetical protein